MQNTSQKVEGVQPTPRHQKQTEKTLAKNLIKEHNKPIRNPEKRNNSNYNQKMGAQRKTTVPKTTVENQRKNHRFFRGC